MVGLLLLVVIVHCMDACGNINLIAHKFNCTFIALGLSRQVVSAFANT